MPDWTSSMQQTFEYYIVDPNTWKDIRALNHVKSSSVNWDSETQTLCSATIDTGEPIGEHYIRIYLVTIQNGVREKHPIATVLVQTPSMSFDGKTKDNSLDAYSPLLELKENYPDIGYFVSKGTNIMDISYQLTTENMRAPVVKPYHSDTLYSDFVSDTEDTWIDFITSLMSNAKYNFMLDEMGRILFSPKQDTASLQPVWTYDDGNSSILQPEISVNQDLYGIPNVVEVICSSDGKIFRATAVNNDPNSITSIQNRGRKITYRDTNPSIIGAATQARVQEYADTLLRELSSIEYSITYTHGYCPVRIGDCVRLNYIRAGLTNIKAKVISQSIDCKPGCQVTEKAVFTKKLWG